MWEKTFSSNLACKWLLSVRPSVRLDFKAILGKGRSWAKDVGDVLDSEGSSDRDLAKIKAEGLLIRKIIKQLAIICILFLVPTGASVREHMIFHPAPATLSRTNR